jgi:hypothetical protein
MMKDYYKILEISTSASTEEIKKAYRRLALKYHPDKNHGDKIAEAKFKELANAYEILSNPEQRRVYDGNRESQSKSKDTTQSKKNTGQEERMTPLIFLSLFKDLKNQIIKIDKNRINQRNLFDSINNLLSNDNINLLLRWDDVYTNRQIIQEVLACCKPLGYDTHPTLHFVYTDRICQKLAKLAGSDNVTIQKIYEYNRKRKLVGYWKKYIRWDATRVVIVVAIILLYLISTESDKSSTSADNSTTNGDLNKSFSENNKTVIPAEVLFKVQKDSLLSSGWQEKDINNGQLPSCYNFNPQKGKIKNYLEIVVGGGTDVAIKVMNLETNECIRYVFVNSGSTYRIRNIPEGQYYLKIAYGKNWLSKIINGQCVGKFIRNPMYSKGDDIFDFNLQYTSDGYSIPSFRLSLDVIATDISNSFNSQTISEDEFNL